MSLPSLILALGFAWVAQAGVAQDPVEAFDLWCHEARSHRVGEIREEEGVRLARARRGQMLEWIQTDPRLALTHSLAWDEWTALPAAVRAEVETPFSARADLMCFSNCSPADSRDRNWQSHQVKIGARIFDLWLAGPLAEVTPKRGLPMQGIVLGGRAAVWDACLYPLAAEEVAAAMELFPEGNPSDRCWVTGAAVAGERVCALLGGKVYTFGSRAELSRAEKVLSTAARGLSPYAVERALAGLDSLDEAQVRDGVVAADNDWTETPKQVLCLRLDYTPPVGTPYSEPVLRERMQIASDSIREMSYGKTWTVATVTPQVLSLPRSYEYYNTTPGYRSEIADDARAAAAAAGYDLGAFDIHVYAFPRLWRTTTPAWAGGSNQWLNGDQFPSVMVHEFGHNYGLGHANSWRGYTGTGFEGRRNPDFSLVEHAEYGDVFDLMGNDRWWSVVAEPVFPAGHFSMRGKAVLNWIEADEVVDVRASGVYRVYRFDHRDARQVPGNPHALKVTTEEGSELWIGFRRGFPSNASLSSGAYLVWAQPGRTHRLLDATPLSRPFLLPQFDMEDAALGVGKSYTDPSGTVRLTNLGWGGVAPREYLDVRVELLPEGTPGARFELFADAQMTEPGLTGSYVNWSLRGLSWQLDWRKFPWAIAGSRVDVYPGFTVDDWGPREPLGLTWGSEENWELFSVQWDGWLRVMDVPMRFSMSGDDGSQLWIDLNQDGWFAPLGSEYLSHHWGLSGLFGLSTHSPMTVAVPPGVYPVRIQREEGFFSNHFILFGIPSEK